MKRSLPWAAFTGLLIAAGGTTTAVVIITAMTTGAAPPIAAAVGAVLLWGGGTCLYSREKPPPVTVERPTVVIDWHLTDVCADITCPCTPHTTHHLDGYMFGRFRCPNCGRFFQMQNRFDAYEQRVMVDGSTRRGKVPVGIAKHGRTPRRPEATNFYAGSAGQPGRHIKPYGGPS